MASKKMLEPWKSNATNSSMLSRILTTSFESWKKICINVWERLLTGKTAKKGPAAFAKTTRSPKQQLADVPREQWFDIRLDDDALNDQIEQMAAQMKDHQEDFEKQYEEKREKLTAGDDLAPGVLKMAKFTLR